ncbi:hypothetical protein V6N13_120709 [Hibiscus sabdariffa]|uniref:Uncharacterized protein n=1 Tax=Hibiscus sabdariffa TaxID=183260 RepID=A0ABR2E5P8_9ROSI
MDVEVLRRELLQGFEAILDKYFGPALPPIVVAESSNATNFDDPLPPVVEEYESILQDSKVFDEWSMRTDEVQIAAGNDGAALVIARGPRVPIATCTDSGTRLRACRHHRRTRIP